MRYTRHICMHNGRHSVVLRALGCGTLGSQSEDITVRCSEVLQKSEFQGRFNRIVFALISGRNNNFDMLREVLQDPQV